MNQGAKSALSVSLLYACALGFGCSDPEVESNEVLQNGDRPGIGTLKNSGQGKADGVCGEFPAHYYEYLDDTRCRKTVPADQERDWMCPVSHGSAEVESPITGELVKYTPADASPAVDGEVLVGIVPDAHHLGVGPTRQRCASLPVSE